MHPTPVKNTQTPTATLHHYCQNIQRGHLDDVMEMYDLLDFKVVYTPPTKDWIMVGQVQPQAQPQAPLQTQPRFAIQITQVDDSPIKDIELKKRTHIAFLSDNPQAIIDKVRAWAEKKNLAFREGGWSAIERYFDLPDVFNNFVVEIMHTSIVEA